MNYSKSIQNPLKLRDWAVEDQPRGKIVLNGVQSLSNAELLSILLGSGSKNENVLELAKHVMCKSSNNLNELGKLSMKDLMSFHGIGRAKASIILSALEMGKRRRSSEVIQKNQVRNSGDIFELFHSRMTDLNHEECWLLLMNNQHKVIESLRISHGGVSETTIDPKIILKYALDKLATSIVLCHNHPSGNPNPSACDDKITQKIKSACGMLDIQFTDHVIFSESGYFSYADEGKI